MSLYIDIEKELPSFTLKVKLNHEKGILGFLGESGSGKSMTLKCIAGIENPTRGKIILNDKVLFDSDRKINIPIKDRNIGYLFQNYALFPHMTVKENIQVGLKRSNKSDRDELINIYAKKFFIEELLERYPWQLSGGQQQRVALARVLITSPDIILLDEPFSALDYHLRINMEKELLNMLTEYDNNIIFVTHDIQEAYRVCDDIVVYDKGVANNKRDAEELFTNPNSITEAKITGCDNISRAQKLNSDTVYAKDWGYKYKVSSNLDESSVNYIGIRKHNIEISDEVGENSYYFTIKDIIDNPFSNVIYLENPAMKNSKAIKIEVNNKDHKYSLEDQIVLKFNNKDIFTF